MLKILGACAASGLLFTAFGQQPLQVQIVSPVEGMYLSDRLLLEARIIPLERRAEIKEVTFFADGRVVCRSRNIQRPTCDWDAGPVIKSHLIRVVADTVSGERLVASVRTREVDVKQSVNVQVVQVNASVADRDGRFVPGLTREQFRLLEDGKPQTILHLANEEAPLELVMAVDISGSMGIAIEELKAAVRQFLSRLRTSDRVTLVAFNEEMFVLTDRESDPAARLSAVDQLTAWGGTTLYDVILRSLDLLSRQPGRRSLVVFSDGEDQSSQATFAAVDRALRGSDAALFMVGLGRGRKQAALRDTLEVLAEPTGGRALFSESPAELGATFATLLAELSQQYLVGYESTNSKKDGAWRKLELEVPGTRYRVRARQGYFGPTQ